MASQETITEVVSMLFRSPLANKPKPLPGETEAAMIKNTIRIFHMALQDMDDDLLQAATIQHLTAEKWFPSIADLRAAAVGLLRRADGTPDAYTAWASVKRWMNRGPEPHPLAVKAINSLGGIKEYGQSLVEDEGQWRARFIMAYETYQNREIEDAMMLPQIANYIEKRQELNGRSISGLIEGAVKKLTGKQGGR